MAMEGILEQQRRYHEERERLVDSMVKDLVHKKSTVSPAELNTSKRLMAVLFRIETPSTLIIA